MAHWRSHIDSSLMGAYSLYDDATDGFKEIDGYILRCNKESHTLGQSGKKDILVAYTSIDNKKPMKVNVIIGNEIALSAGSKNPDKWINVPVTFYVDERVKSKDGIVAAIRVRARKEVKKDFTSEIKLINDCNTLEDLLNIWNLPNFPRIELETVKNKKKDELSKN